MAQRRNGARAQWRKELIAPLRRCALAAFTTVLAAAPVEAQSDPRLTAAVRLAQDGMSDSARAVVGRLLASLQQGDSLYSEALYTMGFLAATESDRRLYLRRVVVDYALSSWADDALLQLAQLDYASGNPAATVRQVERLLRDYPGTPLTATAALWGARAASDRREHPAACRLADAGLAAAVDVELRNQLEFQKQRCQGLAAMAVSDSLERRRADSVAKAPPPRGTSTSTRPPARPSAGFYVQVSAVRTRAAANTEIARIRRAGHTAVAVSESGLLKIRVGPFGPRAEADAAAADLRQKLGARPFVVRVP